MEAQAQQRALEAGDNPVAERDEPAFAQQVKAGVIWRSGSQIVGQLIAWTSTFLVIRMLSPADYGLVAMTGVVLTFLALFNGWGFASALVRDERTLKPSVYLQRLPTDLAAGPVFLVDPMLATGGSASEAIAILRAAGAADLRMICLVASPEGIRLIQRAHPSVTIYTAAIDRELNEKGYILPGLGDAGDRMYGTM